MLNEGIVVNSDRTLIKSEMIRRLQELGRTTPDGLERAVFESLTGGRREDIDWDVEDNKAGYYLWTKTFDGLVTELIEDGYLLVEDAPEGKQLVAPEPEPGLDVSQLVYPRPSEA